MCYVAMCSLTMLTSQYVNVVFNENNSMLAVVIALCNNILLLLFGNLDTHL